MPDALLSLRGVQTHIGRYHILHGVDFDVPEGGLTMLLGRNGAGKTTTLRTIMGLWRAASGEIRFDGRDITRLATPDIARLGIAYVPENMGIFADLTVQENMLLAARSGPPDPQRLDWIFGRFPALKSFWHLPAGKLSGGQKQMLAMARAIVEPRRLLLIDEPTKGLAPAIIANMIDAFRELKRRRHQPAGGRAELRLRPPARRQRGRDGRRQGGAYRRHGGVRRRCRPAAASARPRHGRASMKRARLKRDYLPMLLVPVLAVIALPLIGSPSTWLTLTVAGLAMGMMIFIIASGLTLVFGLMDVLNFGHGVFIAVGAFVATSVMLALAPWMTADSLWLNLAAVGPAMLAAMVVSGALGFVFERVIVRPVYGQHLKQILVTTGGLIVGEQLIKVIWGPDQIPLPRPTRCAAPSCSATSRSRSTACWPSSSAWWCSPPWR